MTWTITKAVEIAKMETARVANLKDSQLYLSRKGRELREIARELTASGKALICSRAAIKERFGKFFPEGTFDYSEHSDKLHIWSFNTDLPRSSTKRVNIYIAMIK